MDNCIYYQKGFKYQLTRDYRGNLGRTVPKDVIFDWFEIKQNGDIWIRRGYAWDGPSGPTIDTPSFMRGSLIHDVIYQCIRLSLLPHSWRVKADKILREVCIEDKMWKFRAAYVYKGVRLGGSSSASKSHMKKEYKAP